jgi:beta-lactamase class A
MNSTIKNIETENFRATLNDKGEFQIKAIAPGAKALYRLKKYSNPTPSYATTATELLEELDELEAKVKQLAGI